MFLNYITFKIIQFVAAFKVGYYLAKRKIRFNYKALFYKLIIISIDQLWEMTSSAFVVTTFFLKCDINSKLVGKQILNQ